MHSISHSKSDISIKSIRNKIKTLKDEELDSLLNLNILPEEIIKEEIKNRKLIKQYMSCGTFEDNMKYITEIQSKLKVHKEQYIKHIKTIELKQHRLYNHFTILNKLKMDYPNIDNIYNIEKIGDMSLFLLDKFPDNFVPIKKEQTTPIIEQVQTPIIEQVQTPIIEQVQTSITEQIQESNAPITEQVQEPVIEPVKEPITAPSSPIIESTTMPVEESTKAITEPIKFRFVKNIAAFSSMQNDFIPLNKEKIEPDEKKRIMTLDSVSHNGTWKKPSYSYEEELAPYDIKLEYYCLKGFGCPYRNEPSKCGFNHVKLGNYIPQGTRIPRCVCWNEKPWANYTNNRCNSFSCTYQHFEGHVALLQTKKLMYKNN